MALLYSLKLLDSDPVIRMKMIDALVEEINKRVVPRIPQLQVDVRALLRTKIEESEEYNDLINGRIDSRRAHFGLRDPRRRLSAIVDVWINSVQVQYRVARRLHTTKIVGGIDINAIHSSFLDVTLLLESIVFSRGGIVPWLEWMLLDLGSDTTVIDNYEIVFGTSGVRLRNSRSGYAVMVKNEQATYRVPPKYLGTRNDNWITRIVDELEDDIVSLIKKVLD